jgi:hypothetical protein
VCDPLAKVLIIRRWPNWQNLFRGNKAEAIMQDAQEVTGATALFFRKQDCRFTAVFLISLEPKTKRNEKYPDPFLHPFFFPRLFANRECEDPAECK